jgi:hypothetical protein
MTYDHWKTTNPADQWLGPEPEEDDGMNDEPMIHDPGNATEIEHVYVFMSIDAEGRNGIVGGPMPGLGNFVQFVTASPKVVEMMKKAAEQLAKETGKPIGMFAFKRETQLWWTEAGS